MTGPGASGSGMSVKRDGKLGVDHVEHHGAHAGERRRARAGPTGGGWHKVPR